MAAEVVMHKLVYLRDVELIKKSRHHTAYAGDGAVHGKPAGGLVYKLTFVNGIARNVEDSVYRRFHDLGVADLRKPVIEKSEEEF